MVTNTSATIKDVSDFFKTGDPKRDSLSAFKAEWLELNDEERDFFKNEVGAIIGK